MAVCILVFQAYIFFIYVVECLFSVGTVKQTTFFYRVAKPILAQAASKLMVYSVPEGNFKTTYDCEHLLRNSEIKSVQSHGFFSVLMACRHISPHPFFRDNIFKIRVFQFWFILYFVSLKISCNFAPGIPGSPCLQSQTIGFSFSRYPSCIIFRRSCPMSRRRYLPSHTMLFAR